MVARARGLTARHSVENQWDLVRALSPSLDRRPNPATDPVEMRVASQVARRLEARLAASGVQAHESIVLVHVSAGNPFRRWPEDSFVALVAGLAIAEPNRRILLTAGPSEAGAAARIATDARRRLGTEVAEGAVLAVDDLDLAALRALMARAALFIGGDSGPLHVAATSSVPIVGLFGPTLAARSAPWRDPAIPTVSIEGGPLPCRPCEQRTCVPGDFRCLTHLTAYHVLHAAQQLLAQPAGARESF
jgi:ADP-heptose:LPS heptosyltransferase